MCSSGGGSTSVVAAASSLLALRELFSLAYPLEFKF